MQMFSLRGAKPGAADFAPHTTASPPWIQKAIYTSDKYVHNVWTVNEAFAERPPGGSRWGLSRYEHNAYQKTWGLLTNTKVGD